MLSTQEEIGIIQSGKTTTIDFYMYCVGSINGKVTDDNGNIVSNKAINATGYGSGYTYTSLLGTYTLRDLSLGTYTIESPRDNYLNLLSTSIYNIKISSSYPVTIDLKLTIGGILEGHVTDPYGNIVENARVLAPDVSNQTYTTSIGSYTLSALPSGKHRLLCSPPNGTNLVAVEKYDVSVTAQQTTETDFVLPIEGIISGQVTDISGNLLSNVMVYVTGIVEKSVYSTAAGTYTIRGLRTGSYKISYVPLSGTTLVKLELYNVLVTTQQTTTVNAVIPEGGVLQGRITDFSGNPVASAGMSLLGVASKYTTTTSTGGYTFRGLASGIYSLTCTSPQNSNLVNLTEYNISVTTQQTTTLNLLIPKYGTVEGVVTDYDGNPVYNAKVSLSGPTSKSVYSLSSGSYSIIGLKYGSYTLSCAPPANSELKNWSIYNIMVATQQTTAINVTLPKAPVLIGTVTDTLGNPIPNVLITVSDSSSKKGFTSALGTYTISGLNSGSYTIAAWPSSGSFFVRKYLYGVVIGTQQVVVQDFVLATGGIVCGKVTDIDGNPVAMATVSINSESTYTSSIGTYTISGISTGTFNLSCSPQMNSGLFSKVISNVTVRSATSTVVDMLLDPQCTMVVTAKDSNDNTVSDANVEISGPLSASMRTNSVGNATINYLPKGTYYISCTPPTGSALLSKTTYYTVNNKTSTVTIYMNTGATLSGIVTDKYGNRISGVSISVGNGSFGYSVMTTSSGAYTITGLQKGNYHITSEILNNSQYLNMPVVYITILELQNYTQNIILNTGGVLQGRVLDSSRNPVINASVDLISSGYSKNVYSSSVGSFTFTGLGESSFYYLRVDPPVDSNFVGETISQIVVPFGQTITQDVILGNGIVIQGRVTDIDGNLLSDAKIYVNDSQRNVKTGYTSNTGTYTVNGIENGKYNILCSPLDIYANLSVAVYDITISSQSTRNINFVLLPGCTVVGQVLNEWGAVISSANVSISGPVSRYLETRQDGKFCFTSIPQGNYVYTCTPRKSMNYVSQQNSFVVDTDSGVKVVNIVLSTGAVVTGKVVTEDGKVISNGSVIISDGINSYSCVVTSTGTYSLYGIKCGTYTLSGSAIDNSNYYSRVYNNFYVNTGETLVKNIVIIIGHKVYGRILSTDGTGISGCQVSVVGEKSVGSVIFGLYEISGLRQGVYKFIVEPPKSYNSLSQTKTGVSVGDQDVNLDIVLSPGGIVDGKVVDLFGNPIPNAVISIIGNTFSRWEYTSNIGTFTIRGIPDGMYSIRCTPPSDRDLSIQVFDGVNIAVGKSAIVDFVLKSKGIVTGRVTDINNNPVEHAYIEMRSTYSAGESSYYYAYTGNLGYFYFNGVNENMYKLTCTPSSSYNLVGLIKDGISVTARTTTVVELHLDSGGILQGKVVDETGRYLTEAIVQISESSGSTTTSTFLGRETYTILGLTEGIYSVTCAPYWYIDQDLVSQTVSQVIIRKGQTTTLDFVLPTGGILTGKVMDEQGRYLSTPRVFIGGYGTKYECLTESGGAYRIKGVPGGKYSLVCEDITGGYGVEVVSSVTVTLGKTTNVDFIMKHGNVVQGQVVDETGTPVSNVTVRIDNIFRETKTNSYGAYIIKGVPSGVYTILFTTSTYINKLFAPFTRNVVVSTNTQVIYVSISQQTPAITGTVYCSDNTTLLSGSVLCLGKTGVRLDTYDNLSDLLNYRQVSVNSKYGFSSVKQGMYDLYSIQGSTIISVVQNVEAKDGEITVQNISDISGTGGISCKVNNSGNSVNDITVWATNEKTNALAGFCTVPSVDSKYVLPGLNAGAYTVYTYIKNVGLQKVMAVEVVDGKNTELECIYNVNYIPLGNEKVITGDNCVIEISSGTFNGDTQFFVNANVVDARLAAADQVMPAGQLLPELVSSVWELKAVNANGITMKPQKMVKLKLHYPSIVPANYESKIGIYHYNTGEQRWNLIESPQAVNTIDNYVTTEIGSFSYFRLAICNSARDNLNVIVYPNPWYKNTADKLVFKGLTQVAEIRIYNVAGEQVWTYKKNDMTDTLTWNGKNDVENVIASGIYIYVITNDKGEKKTGKLAVVK
ncbi:MAG: carboxypeptidase regulatory-like domain-containing protein [Elusimicrobiota bacterium]